MVIKKDKRVKTRIVIPSDTDDNGPADNDRRDTKQQEEEKVAGYDIGLDISTSVIGISILDEQGNLRVLNTVKLNSTKLTNLWEKADEGIRQIEEIVERSGLVKSDIRTIFVESAAKRFAVGFSSAATILTLSKFNGLISYLCYKTYSLPIIEVNVATARKNIGFTNIRADKRPVKDKVFEYVTAKRPLFPWRKHVASAGKSKGQEVYDSDMKDACDAFVIVYGGKGVRTL